MDNVLTIPIFACVLGLFFYWASFRYKTNNCLMAFLVACYFLVLGGDVLTLSMIFIGTYSIGFWLNYFLAKQEDFGPLNLVSGFVALYIPVFFNTVISSYPGIFRRLLVSLQASLLDTKLLSVLIIVIALVCFVSLIVKKIEPLKARVRDTLAQFEDANALTFIPLLFVVSITSYVAMPTIGYDDLAIHSYIQNQVVAGNFPIFDVSVNVWSYAQWVSNVYYGLAGIYSNVEGRSVLNLFMALSTVIMLIKLFRRHFSTNISLFFVVFASSTPLFILSLTNSQSELISTFLLVSILYCYINYNQNTLVKVLLIFAFSVAIKPSNAIVFGLPFVMFLAKEYELHKLTLFKNVRFYFSLLVSLFIFSSVYIFSFVKTGNPVYPLFNGIFHAPGFPNINFFNSLYSGNFNVNAFLGLIFNTSKYMESNDGVAGFQLLLLPLVLLVSPFLYKRANKEVLFLYAIIISAIVMFYSQQYARYVGPSIFVATVVSCLLLSKIQILNKKVLISILAIFIIANFAHLNRVIWYFSGWSPDLVLMPEKREKFVINNEPILQVNDYLNSLKGTVTVVYPPQKPFASNLKGNYVYLNWYNTEGSDAFSLGEDELFKYILSKNSTHIITFSGVDDALSSVAKNHGELIYQNVLYDVYEIKKERVKVEPKVSFFGDVSVNKNGSFTVSSNNFALYEYPQIEGSRKFNLEFVYSCAEGGVWKDYVEFDRYTNFTNMIRTNVCKTPGVKQKHSLVVEAPFATKNIRIFVQPMSGVYTVYSVALSELRND